jgi:nucleoside-diphosphate-sugar epimerase
MKQNNSQQRTAIGIVGCGWVGLALAKTLLKLDYEVVASSAQNENVNKLRASGINAHCLRLSGETALDEDNASLHHPLFDTQQLVICIPPKLKQGQSNYPYKIRQLVVGAEQAGVKRLILLSSSAVYNGLHGKVDEHSMLDFSAPKVSVMHQAEQAVFGFKGQSCVLRLSGLVGPGRHPGRFLAGKTQMAKPDDPVNLIHQQDAVGLIVAILADHTAQGIFNGVSQTAAKRKDFYQSAAKVLNLPLPAFVSSDNKTSGKQVFGIKARQQLHYKYVFDDLQAWLTMPQN